MRKMKKYISKAMSWIVGFLLLASLSALDSRSWWPTIIFAVCWLYFAVMAYHNGWFYGPESEDEE